MKIQIQCIDGGNMLFQPVPACELNNFFYPVESCPACGDSKREVISILGGEQTDAGLSLLVCKECGHVHYNKLPNDEWHDNFYKANWDKNRRSNSKVEVSPFPGSFWSHFFALNIPRDAKILDFGCGFGKRMLELKELGYSNVWGVELGEHRAKVAQRYFSDRVVLGSDKEAIELAKSEKFDLIYSTHVLEHIPDPVPTLIRLKEALKPCGLNLVVVPNAFHESPVVTNLYIFHPNLFNQVSLASAFRRAGYNPYNWKPAALDFELAIVGAVQQNWEPPKNSHLFSIPGNRITPAFLKEISTFLREPFEQVKSGGQVGISFYQPPMIGSFKSGYSMKKSTLVGNWYRHLKGLAKIPVLRWLPKIILRILRIYRLPNFFTYQCVANHPYVWIVTGKSDVPLLIK